MELSLISINIKAAILAAAVSLFALGGLWYSPWLFGTIWGREAKLPVTSKKEGHGGFVFAISFAMSVISALAFAAYIGENPPLRFALSAGLFVGVCFVATSFSINYTFGGRSFKLLAIDAGYHILQFLVYGLILGLWH